ncbi:hypothetical protein OkiPb00508_14640 [Escherichia coli]
MPFYFRKECPLNSGYLSAITGHTEQRAKTEAFRTYSQGASIPELAEYVELVRYELNIDFKA